MDSNTPITPEDPRLTAFALGQLEGAQRDAVAAAVAASPMLQAAVAAVQADAQWLRGQLQAAAAQQPLSAALEAQLLKRLEREAASIGERKSSNLGASASDAGTAAAQAVRGQASRSEADLHHDLKADGQRDAKAGWQRDSKADWRHDSKADWRRDAKADWQRDAKADWRRDLEKSARRPIVWWSPFVLPFAVCFVAVATVSLLWWGGSSFPAFKDTQVFAQRRAVSLDKRESALTVKNRHLLTAKNEGLFASRAWAYGRDGSPIRETAMSAQGAQGYLAGEEMLLAAKASPQVEVIAAASVAQALPAVRSRSAPEAPAESVARKGQATEPVPYRSAVGSQPSHLASTSVQGESAFTQADATLARGDSAQTGSALARTDSFLARADSVERSAQVLAEATTLVRPIAAEVWTVADAPATGTPVADTSTADITATDGSGVDGSAAQIVVAKANAVAGSPVLLEVASAGSSAASSDLSNGVTAVAQAVPTATSNSSAALAGVAVAEVAVDMDGDGGGVPLGEPASLSASQLAALAAAKYFSQASIEELQAAAFALEAKPWQTGAGETVAAQVASVEAAGQTVAALPAASPAPAASASASSASAPVSPVRRQNLASRYVQLRLWVEAGQLPPPAAIDVDAIVRDAVPVYAAGTLRQVRAQAAARALVDASAAGAAADASVEPAELAVLEARSLMLRLVRGYATILKERPVDASLQLDALAEQLRQRPRIARGRHGQTFLKLLEATRPLF